MALLQSKTQASNLKSSFQQSNILTPHNPKVPQPGAYTLKKAEGISEFLRYISMREENDRQWKHCSSEYDQLESEPLCFRQRLSALGDMTSHSVQSAHACLERKLQWRHMTKLPETRGSLHTWFWVNFCSSVVHKFFTGDICVCVIFPHLIRWPPHWGRGVTGGHDPQLKKLGSGGWCLLLWQPHPRKRLQWFYRDPPKGGLQFWSLAPHHCVQLLFPVSLCEHLIPAPCDVILCGVMQPGGTSTEPALCCLDFQLPTNGKLNRYLFFINSPASGISFQ